MCAAVPNPHYPHSPDLPKPYTQPLCLTFHSQVDRSEFSNNSAQLGAGLECRLCHITSAPFSAAFHKPRHTIPPFLSFHSQVDISEFSNNSAQFGAGLECRMCQSVTVSRSLFRDNVAGSGAGMALVGVYQECGISSTSFLGNRALTWRKVWNTDVWKWA